MENLQTIAGVINSCNFKKSGQTAEGRTWTIYEVDINGEKFSTFDNGFQNMIGKQGTWNYTTKQTQGQNGKIYFNKTLVVNEVRKSEQTAIQGAPTPIASYDKEKTGKSIARMNALTNAIKFYEGKNIKELKIMTTAETFYKWISDENFLKGMSDAETANNPDNEETINLENIPF